jgi:lipopolysaccharide transport system permease protein
MRIKMVASGIVSHRFLLNFSKYRYLLSELVKRDIKIKYRRSVIGIFWSFLNPLLTMVVLTIIFENIFSMNIANFPVYFLTGMIVFSLFANGTSYAMTSIQRNASIIKKIYVPKYMYSLGVVLSEFVNFLLALIVLFLVMLFTGAPFTVYIFAAILPILLLLIFTIGVGLMLATVTVFFRDIEHLYGVFLTLLMYGSAIFYPADIIPEAYRNLLYYNPVYAFISLCRDSFLYGKSFDPNTLIFTTVSAFVALVVGITLFYKYQDKFILYI